MTPTEQDIRSMKFGSRRIGPGHRVVIIAEIGINHEGDVDACARMIEQSARAGADAVKLQTIDPRENYVPGTPSFELFSKAELTREETAQMFEYAKSLGMEALTTCGDFRTLEWVNRLDPAANKISSGLLTHLPLIRQAAGTGRSMLMSTGMTGEDVVDAAVAEARDAGAKDITLFQCTSQYPAPPETLNLRVIRALRERYRLPTGFSDHSLGHEASVLAVAAGAYVLEKHYSEDISRPSYDHPISLDEAGMKTFVDSVRRAEVILGSDKKVCEPKLAEAAKGFLRSLVARKEIEPGEALSLDNIGFMRTLPENRGMPPGEWGAIEGRLAKVRIERFTAVKLEDLQ